MTPVINDEVDVGTEQEQGQTSPWSTDSEDIIATPTHSFDDTVDVFEGYSLRDRYPVVINIEDEEGGKSPASTVPGYDDPTEYEQRVPPTLLSAPAFPAGTVVNGAMATSAQYRRPNFRRTRQEKTSVSVSDYPLSEVEDDDNEAGDEFDNCPPDSPNPNSGNHNGPPSVKTVSYHLNSTVSHTDTSQTDEIARSDVKTFTFDPERDQH